MENFSHFCIISSDDGWVTRIGEIDSFHLTSFLAWTLCEIKNSIVMRVFEIGNFYSIEMCICN